eukprot:TRINITY_DN10754_c0_g1_i1.p1 TRINITY_DN10754_c0_g1~~TRINITY_DN10754_c0_g1_i1.p1  ORF type:complete len:355 (+),score=72.86 TRINITY_DN10754_c0_g1_i1:26-1090(+)
MDGKRGGKAHRGGKGKKKNEDVWDDGALQRAYQRGVASYQRAHGASLVEEVDEEAPKQIAPAADDVEEGELSDQDNNSNNTSGSHPAASASNPSSTKPAAATDGDGLAAAPAASNDSKGDRTPKRKRSQKTPSAGASPADGAIDEQQREDAWRQYYQQMGYYQPQTMGLPSPAQAPVFRTPTHPARRVPQHASRATPRTPVSVPKPQFGKQKSTAGSDTGYDDDEENEDDVEGGDDDVDESDDGYESGEESEDEDAGYSYGYAPWSPAGSFIPPPSPLFAGMAGFPQMMPHFGYHPTPASPSYSPYMPPPSPVADIGNMMWSAFYAGFAAGQQQSAHSTPRATPKRASKRRKID